MPRGSKPGEHRGGRKPGTPNKRTTELAEAASNALVNAGRAPLPEIVVLRKLGKERLIEIDEIASCGPTFGVTCAIQISVTPTHCRIRARACAPYSDRA